MIALTVIFAIVSIGLTIATIAYWIIRTPFVDKMRKPYIITVISWFITIVLACSL